LKSQIDKEKTGNNPEIDRLKKLKDELAAKIDPVSKELKEARDYCKGSDEIKNLKAERSALNNELEIHNIEDFNDEIKRNQKKLGFGNLNAGEEKKLKEKINRLETQRTKIQKLNEVKTKIVELTKQYGPSLKKIGELSTQLKELTDKKKKTSDELKKIWENKKANDPEIKNLQFQRESIKGEIEKLKLEITDIEHEWNDKWYHYEQQQKVLDYIKEATNKINMLKKKADRDRKRREKMEKKGKGEAMEEEDSNAESTPKEKVYFAYEISSCEWLIKYFKDLIGEGKSSEADKAKEILTSQSKINDDLKAGALKVLNRDDKFPTVDSSAGFKNKKKMKKENQNKKAANNFLVLDISLISRVKELGLTPPVFADAVKPFIGELETKKSFYEDEAQKKLAETPEVAPETVIF